MALTYFQSETVLQALRLAKKFGNAPGCEQSTYEEDQLIDKAIKHIVDAIKDGMPIGEHEDDIKAAAEESEEDMTVHSMRKAYGGR